MDGLITLGVLALLIFFFVIVPGVRIITEYERGVVFRLGVVKHVKQPGLRVIIPFIDKINKVNIQTVTMDIPPQDVITKDNVTVKVNAVTYFQIVDPVKAVVNIQNYLFGTSQVAQTTLRSILGQVELDDLLTQRDDINQRLQHDIDQLTDPWGVKVTLVEVKDVELPDTMRRAMAKQAEAERERRAKIIHAEGEYEASERLAFAADVMASSPGSMQLRTLSTMIEVAAEHNSTLIFPIPMEFLRFLEAHTPDDQTVDLP